MTWHSRISRWRHAVVADGLNDPEYNAQIYLLRGGPRELWRAMNPISRRLEPQELPTCAASCVRWREGGT